MAEDAEGRGEGHRPRVWRSRKPTHPTPTLPRRSAQPPLVAWLREVGQLSPSSPQARRRKEAFYTSASSRSPLSPPPDLFFSIQSLPASRRKEERGGGCRHYLLPAPFSQGRPAPARHRGWRGAPGCLWEHSPTPGPPAVPRLPHPHPPVPAPSPRWGAQREGAGKAPGPGPRPLPDPEGKERNEGGGGGGAYTPRC